MTTPQPPSLNQQQQQQQIPAPIFALESFDEPDALEQELLRHAVFLRSILDPLPESQRAASLQEACLKNHAEITGGLMHGILTNPPQSEKIFRLLTFVVRDRFQAILGKLWYLAATDKFQKLIPHVQRQVVWIVGNLLDDTQLVPPLANTFIYLIRQIRGGNLSQDNLLYAKSVLNILASKMERLQPQRAIIQNAILILARMIGDHHRIPQLLAKEEELLMQLVNKNIEDCLFIGRDFIFAMLSISKLPWVASFLQSIARPDGLARASRPDLDAFISRPTPRELLMARLTPDMEIKLAFILQNVHKRFDYTFIERFRQRFITPENETLYPDIIRYICGVIHPQNQIIASTIVQRWDLIVSLLRGIRTTACAQQCKLALYLDWIFYNPNADNVMCLEPGILLLAKSLKRFPYLTATMLEFLSSTVQQMYPERSEQLMWNLRLAMHAVISKDVIPSLQPLYYAPQLDSYARSMVEKLFPAFIQLEKGVPSIESLRIISVNQQHTGQVVSAEHVSLDPDFQFVRDMESLGSVPVDLSDADVVPEPIQEIEIGTTSQILEVIRDRIQDTSPNIGDNTRRLCDNFSSALLTEDPSPDIQALTEEIQSMVVFDTNSLHTPVSPAASVGSVLLQALIDRAHLNMSTGSPSAPIISLCIELGVSQSAVMPLVLALESRRSLTGSPDTYSSTVFSQCFKEASVLSAIESVLDSSVEVFFEILPRVLQVYSSILSGDKQLFFDIVSSIDAQKLATLRFALYLDGIRLFSRQTVSLLIHSLTWTSIEQWITWDLLASEMGSSTTSSIDKQQHLQTIVSFCESISKQKSGLSDTPEVMQGVVSCAGRSLPTGDAVSAVLIGLKDAPEVVCVILSQWASIAGVDRVRDGVRAAISRFSDHTVSKIASEAIEALFDMDDDNDDDNGRGVSGSGTATPTGDTSVSTSVTSGASPTNASDVNIDEASVVARAESLLGVTTSNLRAMLETLSLLRSVGVNRSGSRDLANAIFDRSIQNVLKRLKLPVDWQPLVNSILQPSENV